MNARLHEHRDATIFGIVQVAIVVGGWMATAIHMKWMGYPDMADRMLSWNPVSLFIRHHGALLFLVPAIWIPICLYFETSERFAASKQWTFFTGILTSAVLFFLLMDSAVHPYTRRTLLLQ